jgi:hypothetical protein
MWAGISAEEAQEVLAQKLALKEDLGDAHANFAQASADSPETSRD